MKIIQVVESLDVGGLEKIALTLSNELALENEVTIISLNSLKKETINKWIKINPKIKIIELKKEKFINKNISKLGIVKMILKMRNIIKNEYPNVIHSHHIGPLFYTSLSTLGLKVKRIHTEHDIWYLKDKKNLFFRKIISKIAFHKTISLTNKMKNELNKNFGIKNVSTIFNGIDIRDLKEIKNAKKKLNIKESFVIGACGRIVDVKNHKYLVEQAKKNKDIRFLIAGDGYLLKELKKASPENVTFMGHKNDLSLFYSAIDAFVIPSKNEGLPLSILESYYYNKPVFSTNVGSIFEVIKDDKYIINTKNDLEIKKIKQNQKINMKNVIENNFSLSVMVNNYLKIYKE